MHAKPGDWLVIKGIVVDAPEQLGQILEVHSGDGGPPFLVRWTRDDRESLIFPGPDAHVRTATEQKTADEHMQQKLLERQKVIGRHSLAHGGEDR
jgi:hypothetical protein